MATEIKMPQLGESIHEGTITRWLKQPGDSVRAYEPLLEVTTDKITSEVTAPAGGTLTRILVPEGATVKVDTTIALIETVAATEAAPPPGTPAPPIPPPSPPSAARPPSPLAVRVAQEHGIDPASLRGSGVGGQVTKEDVLRAAQAQEHPAPAQPAAAPAPILDASAPRSLSGFLSPRVQMLARELGVDPTQVPGSGRDGRVTARDVETYAQGRGASGAAMPRLSPSPAPPHATAHPAGRDELVPLSPMRRAIAEHMSFSERTAPHVTTVHEADVTRLAQVYERERDAFQRREGFALTYTSFFVMAAVAALRAMPAMNVSFTDEGIIRRRDIHIGVAVALADGGLVVPVIRNADEKTLVGVARDLADLAARARAGGLAPDETRGGTFTITNHGVFGSLLATPIIHQPQAAILGVGAIQKRVVVVETETGDSLAVRRMVYLSLSFDHRALDGAAADQFMRRLVGELEHGQWSL
ncbi:MAG: 2-oxo acid dehydrogenase subunit E2 [Anaerolineae bacterium]